MAKDGQSSGGESGVPRGGKLLLAVAAPAEARAIAGRDVEEWVLTALSPWVDLVRTGVGKANAAGGVARLCDPLVHGAVVSIGIAGTYGGAERIGSVVVATESVFADEGVQTPAGFEDLARRGFPPWMGMDACVPASVAFMKLVAEALTDFPLAMGTIATVSMCSGTSELATAIVARTRKLSRVTSGEVLAEAMEGAAVGASAARLGVDFGEVRVISNTTGDRDKQKWDLAGSLKVLGEVGRALVRTMDRLREADWSNE